MRLSYAQNPNGFATRILEENHYYPFGLKHTNYDNETQRFMRGIGDGDDIPIFIAPDIFGSSAFKYKYNGKEWQDELGLNMYAMDMRIYDPAIARWTSIDPVTHYSMSTYSAFNDNPVFWADPSGASGEHYNWNTRQYENDKGKQVSFADAMASHGLNSDGDPVKTTTDAGHGDKTGCCYDPGTIDGTNYEKDYALKV